MSFGFGLDVMARFVCNLSHLICKIQVICNKYLIKTLAKPCGVKLHNEAKCPLRNFLFKENIVLGPVSLEEPKTPKNNTVIYDRDWSCLGQIMLFDLIFQSSIAVLVQWHYAKHINGNSFYLQCSSISGTDLVLFSSKHSEPSSSLSENTESCGCWDDTRKVVHSWRIRTGLVKFEGDEVFIKGCWPNRRLAVSSKLFILLVTNLI